MAADEKWYFTKEQLQNTPSRLCGFDADKELSYRQQAANFIQDMGQKLQVSQLCINTAIVYMHRFYMFHSFTHFPWNTIAAASFFLAAKVEEQPRKLEHVIRVANHCLHRDQPTTFDAKSEQYAAQSQDLVFNENALLQTLGFDVAIDHPHTHVVRCCHLVRASKDLAQTSYFMASNSLHLTTMCLQYKPTVVACFCIHLACKWSNWQIPKSNEGKDWFYYVDKSVSSELLEQLTAEFLKIFDKCPSRLKRKITSISNVNQNHSTQTIDQLHAAANSNSPFDPDSRKFHSLDIKDNSGPTFLPRTHHEPKPGLLATPEDPHKKPQRQHDPSTSQPQQPQPRGDYREYREKKERERLEREKSAQQHHGSSSGGAGKVAVPPASVGKHMAPSGTIPATSTSSKPSHSNHHRPSMSGVDPAKMKMHHRPAADTIPAMSGGHREHSAGKDMLNGREQHAHPREHPVNKDTVVKVDSASTDNSKQRYDTNRQKVVDPNKLQMKQHDPNRHRRDVDPNKYQKQRPDGQQTVSSNSSSVNLGGDNKKPGLVSSSAQDKQNTFMNKQMNSTSQRHKSPFPDAAKSVPVPTSVQTNKTDTRNGNHSATAQLLSSLPASDVKQWPADSPQDVDPGLSTPPPIALKKTSSLFSPEKTPPHKKAWNTKTPPNSGKRSTDTPQLPMQTPLPLPISPFTSPPPKLPVPPSLPKRSRTSSSGSEPELRPVVKKLDQISGFENIIRDSKMGIKLPKVPDIIQPICDRTTSAPLEPSISKELKPPDIIKPFNTSSSESIPLSQPLVNGIETDPAVISTLLKEAVPPINHLVGDVKITEMQPIGTSAIVGTSVVIALEPDKHKSEHHHKSEKKKKKDKHKHKDKDKSKDEKKKKHKDKDKERHKIKPEKNDQPEVEVPLKITISKNNYQPPSESTPALSSGAGSGLKVKISKDRLKSDVINEPPVKIKILKDQMQFHSIVDNNTSSRKRERDKSSQGVPTPPLKIAKTSYNRNQDNSRQNGRNSYNKVSQLGDGEASQLRLAESKYHSKGASKAS